jgi:NitT/TauT family transport system substrate-binding protein
MIRISFRGPSLFARIMLGALLWLAVIGGLHAYLNGERRTSEKILMGYMPVITNLAAPLVDAVTRGQEPRFEALKFGSFAEMAEAFRTNHIQVAFIIAPLAIRLHEEKVPLKVVYIGNRHESTLVVTPSTTAKSLVEMSGKTIAVPIRYSGHLLALRRYLRECGLGPEAIRTVEIPPPDMPAAIGAGGIDGYFVGEPFASKAIVAGIAKRILHAESIWPGFICNLMIVRAELVENRPEVVQTLVSVAVRSGFWAARHVDQVVTLAARYWGQDPEVVRHAFSNPPGRVRFDLYTPAIAELQDVAREMALAGQTQSEVNVAEIVEDRFARAVLRAWSNRSRISSAGDRRGRAGWHQGRSETLKTRRCPVPGNSSTVQAAAQNCRRESHESLVDRSSAGLLRRVA